MFVGITKERKMDDCTVCFFFKTKEEKQEFLGYMSDGGGEQGLEEYCFEYSDWDNDHSDVKVTHIGE